MNRSGVHGKDDREGRRGWSSRREKWLVQPREAATSTLRHQKRWRSKLVIGAAGSGFCVPFHLNSCPAIVSFASAEAAQAGPREMGRALVREGKGVPIWGAGLRWQRSMPKGMYRRQPIKVLPGSSG
jgi:hypothetical protein